VATKSISIPVTGNTAPLRKSLTKAEKDLKRFSAQAKNSARSAAMSFAAAGAGAAIFASKMNRAYEEASTADARIAQVGKSMGLFGDQVGTVTDRLVKLARQTALQTGVDANQIKLTQAKLLTFKELAKTAGTVGGAFDRATAAAVDMAAAGFGEASSNAVQLGKALQDPIKGITALSRSGITFTDQEKDKIRTLVESNKTLEAQTLILEAIEKQVKGTAAATANASDKMNEGLRAVREQIGAGLAPAFEALAVQAGKFATFAEKNPGKVAALAVGLGGLATAILVVKGAMAAATAVSVAYAAAQAAVAAGNIAVQASTVVGIATATAAAGAIAILTKKVYDSVNARKAERDATIASTNAITDNTYGLTQNQYALATFIGPLNAVAAAQRENLYLVLQSRIAAEKYREEQERLKVAAQQAAVALKERQARAFEDLKNRTNNAKKAIRDYVAFIRSQINAEVSLSSAFSAAQSQQEDRISAVNDALKNRRDAYAALHQARATNDAKAYGAALQDVARAEAAVKSAQDIKPKDYSAIFAEQIAAAKNFAGLIPKLISAGLGKAGLAQILDLGPVAGAQVAKDLLAGTSGLTVRGLESDLASIAAAGTAAGMAMPGFTAALGTTVGGTAAAPTIIVNAGVGDPVQIGKEVASVLNAYGAKTGGVPIVTKKPKAKAKQKPSKTKGG